MNEHGYCPKCGCDLDGGSIWKYFFEQSGSEDDADRTSAMYGATRERGQWGREIGIYDLNTDRTIAWQCPDCGHQWDRV